MDANSPYTLQHQLKKEFYEKIASKEWLPGQLIPSEKELCDEYGVSRITVREALRELVQANYLVRKQGKGTFVAEPKIKQEYISKIQSFNDEILHRGMTPSTEVLQFLVLEGDEIPAEVIEAFQLSAEEKVIFLHRKRMADGRPIVHSKTFLPYALCSKVFQYDLNKERLYSILDMSDETRIHHLDRTIEAVEAGTEDAKLLEMEKKKPIQYIRSVGYNSFGKVIEYTMSRYRGDRNQFTVTVFHEVN